MTKLIEKALNDPLYLRLGYRPNCRLYKQSTHDELTVSPSSYPSSSFSQPVDHVTDFPSMNRPTRPYSEQTRRKGHVMESDGNENSHGSGNLTAVETAEQFVLASRESPKYVTNSGVGMWMCATTLVAHLILLYFYYLLRYGYAWRDYTVRVSL